jgi:hypothetical protein
MVIADDLGVAVYARDIQRTTSMFREREASYFKIPGPGRVGRYLA